MAGFPVAKGLDGFRVIISSALSAAFDYLASWEWVQVHGTICLSGPARTVGLGHGAVAAGHRVRYFAGADLVETLYRGLADNSVGELIDQLLRADLVPFSARFGVKGQQ